MIIAKSDSKKYSTKIISKKAQLNADVADNASNAFQPHELLCAGLAACLDITVRMILEHKNIVYDEVIVKVDIDTTDADKTKFCYNIDILGDVPAVTKKRVIEIAQNCPVKKTLSKQIEFTLN